MLAPATAAAALPVALLVLAPGGRLGRVAGGVLVATYAGYVVFTLGR